MSQSATAPDSQTPCNQGPQKTVEFRTDSTPVQIMEIASVVAGQAKGEGIEDESFARARTTVLSRPGVTETKFGLATLFVQQRV